MKRVHYFNGQLLSTGDFQAEQDYHFAKQCRGRAFIAIGVIIFFSLLQLCLAVVLIPRFSNIYQDLLDGKPLPLATAIVLNSRWLIASLACVLPLVASILVQRRASLLYLVSVIALLLVLTAFTTIALFLPLVGKIQTVSPPQQSTNL
jgi:type II secretory pathway component PulF